jgi:hypothetical protein
VPEFSLYSAFGLLLVLNNWSSSTISESPVKGHCERVEVKGLCVVEVLGVMDPASSRHGLLDFLLPDESLHETSEIMGLTVGVQDVGGVLLPCRLLF